jgi:hypothetical protein
MRLNYSPLGKINVCGLHGVQLDGGRASDCGGSGNAGGNGTATVSYAGLEDGNHTLAVCASRRGGGGGGQSPTCATYAWDVG